jgi:opacity protein-like surface antigen
VGATLPTGEFGDRSDPSGDAKPSVGFGLGFAYAVRGGLYLHLGFSQHRFGCTDGCANAGDLTATGFDLALRYLFDTGAVKPWLRAGLLPYTIEGSTAGQDGTGAVSDHTWGFEVGGGVSVRLSEPLSLAPGLRYVALDPTLAGVGPLPIRAWVLDLGLVWGF